MKNFFLVLSGLLYGLVAVLHLVRFLLKWSVTVGGYTIPLKASLWACLVFLILSLGCLVARGREA